MSFNPHGNIQPCWTCIHLGEQRGPHIWCLKTKILQANPDSGCSLHEREVGSDDEAWWLRP